MRIGISVDSFVPPVETITLEAGETIILKEDEPLPQPIEIPEVVEEVIIEEEKPVEIPVEKPVEKPKAKEANFFSVSKYPHISVYRS